MGKRKYIFDDLVGKKINFLTPESVVHGVNKWNFRCDCGNLVEEYPTIVYNGARTSCGCKRVELTTISNHKRYAIIREEKAKSMIGKRFGRLKVIGYEPIESKRKTKLICQCDCGNVKSIFMDSLTYGLTKSCGCYKREISSIQTIARNKENAPLKRKGIEKDSHLYIKWEGMKARCYNKNAKNYSRYGGKGITMCDDWLNHPELFIKWAEDNGGLDENLTIDRIDPYGPYSPENCRFVTIKEQNRNKKGTIKLTINGITKSLMDFADDYDINPKLVRARLKRGWSAEKALITPVDKRYHPDKYC